ncbi:hypothetical protein ABT160_18920, partial [Streptomyces sp. NPDC001941]|uniref:hypothetical protein n=1 Tax=Streptomyces sp. NPDC001941 TaxID=3154659 RepID=UPI00331B17A3
MAAADTNARSTQVDPPSALHLPETPGGWSENEDLTHPREHDGQAQGWASDEDVPHALELTAGWLPHEQAQPEVPVVGSGWAEEDDLPRVLEVQATVGDGETRSDGVEPDGVWVEEPPSALDGVATGWGSDAPASGALATGLPGGPSAGLLPVVGSGWAEEDDLPRVLEVQATVGDGETRSDG